MSDLLTKTQIEKIVNFALEAGEIAVRSFVKKDFSIEKKSDGSRVTSADIAVSKFLREHLEKEFPKIPIICEEGELREVSGDVFFLIDPIDGTSSFIAGNVEFCINIALIKNKKPIFGLIYAPLFEDGKMVFSNGENSLSICFRQQHRQNFRIFHLARDNKKRSEDCKKDKLRIITSTRSKDSDVENYMIKNYPEFSKNFTTEKLASAIKFFRLIEGDADFYLHFRPSMEWDTAAGHALVEMLGGTLRNLPNGEILTYKKPGFENKPFTSIL